MSVPVLRDPVTACQGCDLFGGSSCPFARRTAGAGQQIVGQGERPAELAFVRSGVVGLSTVAEDGTQTWGAIRGPRTLIGLEGTTGEPVPCEARTLTEVELCVAPMPMVAAWAQTPDGARRLLALAVRELAAQRDDLDLRSGPVGVRVARFLLAYERVVSARRAIPKAQIAALLGMRAETLSRVLRRFVARGLLRSATGLAIGDREGLERTARG